MLTFIPLFGDEWKLHRFNVYFEDDIYSQTDDEYSAGERFTWLY